MLTHCKVSPKRFIGRFECQWIKGNTVETASCTTAYFTVRNATQNLISVLALILSISHTTFCAQIVAFKIDMLC